MKSNTRISVLSLSGPACQITLRIRTRLEARQRRAVALAFYRQIKPWLRYIHQGYLNDDRHEISDFDAKERSSKEGRLGFELRMRRLEIGMTLRELSRRSGVSISQLSAIERGLCKARPSTIRSVRSAQRLAEVRPFAGIEAPQADRTEH